MYALKSFYGLWKASPHWDFIPLCFECHRRAAG